VVLKKDVFLTFGDGSHGWKGAKKRIIAEAIQTDFFGYHLGFNLRILGAIDPNLKKLVKALNKKQNRGFGYWAWKPASAYLADLLFPDSYIWYVDAGSSFNFQTDIKKALGLWKNFAIENNGLAFALSNHPEYNWTKKELIQLLEVSEAHLQSEQIQAGLFILPPGPNRRSFLLDWIKYSQIDEGFYLTDELRLKQDPNFIEHRHDQSIFSLLWKKYEFGEMADITYPPMAESSSAIFSTRNNTKINFLKHPLMIKTFKELNRVRDLFL